jgi:hypothetical protein
VDELNYQIRRIAPSVGWYGAVWQTPSNTIWNDACYDDCSVYIEELRKLPASVGVKNLYIPHATFKEPDLTKPRNPPRLPRRIPNLHSTRTLVIDGDVKPGALAVNSSPNIGELNDRTLNAKGPPPGSRTAPKPSRPRNLGSSSGCRGGHGTAAKPNSVEAGSDPAETSDVKPCLRGGKRDGEIEHRDAIPRPVHGNEPPSSLSLLLPANLLFFATNLDEAIKLGRAATEHA